MVLVPETRYSITNTADAENEYAYAKPSISGNPLVVDYWLNRMTTPNAFMLSALHISEELYEVFFGL